MSKKNKKLLHSKYETNEISTFFCYFFLLILIIYPCSNPPDYYYKLRPCVSVRLSNFGIISRNYTAYRENKRPNSLVHFRIAFPYRQGFPFENFRTFSNISKVQNHCLKQWFSTFGCWRPMKYNYTHFGNPYITIIVLKHRFWQPKSKCTRPKSGSRPAC